MKLHTNISDFFRAVVKEAICCDHIFRIISARDGWRWSIGILHKRQMTWDVDWIRSALNLRSTVMQHFVSVSNDEKFTKLVFLWSSLIFNRQHVHKIAANSTALATSSKPITNDFPLLDIVKVEPWEVGRTSHTSDQSCSSCRLAVIRRPPLENGGIWTHIGTSDVMYSKHQVTHNDPQWAALPLELHFLFRFGHHVLLRTQVV